ncbi:hypothetical protein [uncultured Paracoccus sp.]|uniref:hypothetical protein n=1 Tax=uncultured Paracoccus sp. TaxID=189685 RepID=UPI0026067CC6|nr:hypothetical protein [uncultured Paracoccus sp.]
MIRGFLPALGCTLALSGPLSAADGIWTQFDLSDQGMLLVTNVEQGRQVYGLVIGDDDDEAWLTLSLLRTWQAGPDEAPWKLRAGPVLRAEQIGAWEADEHDLSWCGADDRDCVAGRAGLRLSVDRWKSYESFGLFLMADYSTIDRARLGVMGLTHLASGLGGQISIYREEDGETTPAAMLSAKLPGSRFSVRLGHKFVEDETFVGISFSTY